MANIKVKHIKCPCCGLSLSLKDQGYGEIKCDYCNAIVFISREDTTDGNITIYSEGENKPIGNVNIPLGWDVSKSYIDYKTSTLYKPFAYGFDLVNNMDSSIHVDSGLSYHIQGTVLYKNEQIPYTIQKEFIPVDKVIDEIVEEYAKVTKQKVKFIEDLDVPIDKFDRKKELEKTKDYYEQNARREEAKTGYKMNIVGIYGDSACRAYEVGKEVVVVYTRVIARLAGAMGANIPDIGAGINNLVNGVSKLINKSTSKSNTNGSILNKMADSGLLGGMLGKKYKTNGEAQKEVKEEIKEEKIEEELKTENTSDVMIGKITHPGQMQFLDWETTPVFVLISNKDNYKTLYKKAFKQVCSSFKVSPQVLSEYDSMTTQMENQINQNNQARAQAQYQHGQNIINMGAQRMANNYKYIDSMRERSNRQFESQRQSYNARMDAQDRMRDKRTEAILGVNTFIKPDGKEVEVPVSADTAWINGKGEIVGGSAGFNPGSGWTQMDKKY